MLLSARMLQDVASVNHYTYCDVVEMSQGDTTYVYFQLIDASVDTANKGFVPGGRRYIPATAATLSCTLTSINTANTITRNATQPYAQDGSIWRLAIQATDVLTGFRDLRLTLTEAGVVTNGVVRHAVNSTALQSEF